jgi:hypothetical protein
VGLFKQIKRQAFKGGIQRPWDQERIVQIVGIKSQGDDLATLDVLYFTGEESVWQPPQRMPIRTIIPEGVEPRIGQRLVVGRMGGGGSQNNAPPPVFWDRPEPELPPMQFPNIPGGDDPEVMLAHLESLVQSGALDQEGLDRARDYLQSRGWPKPG